MAGARVVVSRSGAVADMHNDCVQAVQLRHRRCNCVDGEVWLQVKVFVKGNKRIALVPCMHAAGLECETHQLHDQQRRRLVEYVPSSGIHTLPATGAQRPVRMRACWVKLQRYRGEEGICVDVLRR